MAFVYILLVVRAPPERVCGCARFPAVNAGTKAGDLQDICDVLRLRVVMVRVANEVTHDTREIFGATAGGQKSFPFSEGGEGHFSFPAPPKVFLNTPLINSCTVLCRPNALLFV